MERLSGRAVVKVMLGFVFLHSAVWAQSTAQISGTVKDQTGAVVPGVEVSATQTEGKLNGVGTWTELVTRVFVIEFASGLEKGCGEMRRSPTTLWFTLWSRDERAIEQNL